MVDKGILAYSPACATPIHPPAHLQLLMRRGMDEVLGLAGAEELPEPWPRVHALNVLRVTFNDASLACDSSAYYARGGAAGRAALGWSMFVLCISCQLCTV